MTERFFNETGEDGWGTNEGGSNRYVSDSSAPVDAPTVLEMPFGPCSNCGGNSMGNRIVKLFGTTGPELYVKMTVKYSANWEGNPSGVNKIFYPATPADMGTPGALAAYGLGQESLELQMRLQNQDNGPCGYTPLRNIKQNAASSTLTRGRWHTIEIYARLNTRASGPTCDGELRIWLDGQLTHDYTDVLWLDPSWPAQDWIWSKLNFDPVWGGGRGDLASSQSLFTAYLAAEVR